MGALQTLGTIFPLSLASGKVVDNDPLPGDHRALLGEEEPALSARSKARGIRGAAGRTGLLSIQAGSLRFTYDKWCRSRLWSLDLKRVVAIRLHRRLLIDISEIVHRDDRENNRVVRFAFTKDRSPPSKGFFVALDPQGST